MGALIAAGAASGIAGGLVGNYFASKDRKKQEALIAQSLADLEAVGLPPDLSKRIIMQQFEQAGMLTPELERDIQAGESKVAQIKEDSSLRDAQMQALNKLQQVGATGLRAEDRAALNLARSQAAKDAEAQRQQVMQQMAARGMSGSGMELISQLQAGQAGTDRMSSEGDRIAAMASQNALQSLMQSGQLGGAIRSQDFNVEQTKAQAADLRDQFNIENSRSTQMRNLAAKNQAQAANLANQQEIMNKNVAMENAERQRMEQAKRDYWTDKLSYAQSKAAARSGQAQLMGAKADRTANMWTGIGSSGASALGAYSKYLQNNPTKAEDSNNDDSGNDNTPTGTYKSKAQ